MDAMEQDKAPRAAGAWKRRASLLLGGLMMLALVLAVRYASPPRLAAGAGKVKRDERQARRAESTEPAGDELQAPEKPNVVAVVNREPITREQLARECLLYFGDEVLDTMLNRQLIAEHCKARRIIITHEEVQGEINKTAQRFGLPTDQLLKMLKQERHISEAQYANEIIWPTVALRKLARDELQVSDQEIKQAYEMIYGPAVQTRLIACKTAAEAEHIRRLALDDPENFPNLAKQHSVDVSASAKGLIQPIHMHQGNDDIERAAFALKLGGISKVIQVGDQYVFLKCEAHMHSQNVPLKDVRERLIESIKDNKLREVSGKLFAELKQQAQVEDVFNDPAKRKQHPGVAALINGREIPIKELAEQCIDRHGIEVLEGMITRRLLEQACKRKNIQVGEADIQAEIERAAIAMGKVKTTRRGEEVADVEAWLKDIQTVQHLSEELYRHDVVWPSAALKKLVGKKEIEITAEDMRRSFEANYGPRARCRAIAFNRERTAQQVWAELRDRFAGDELAALEPEEFLERAVEEFGRMAGKYSVDQGTHDAEGLMPPIAKFGTDPLLEKEAFELKAGEMSGVIQVADKFVILFCEGFTTPKTTDFEEVKPYIIADLREKKIQLAMNRRYNQLTDAAQIDNYLTGTSKSPQKGNAVNGLLGATGLLAEPPESGGKPAVRRPAAGKTRK